MRWPGHEPAATLGVDFGTDQGAQLIERDPVAAGVPAGDGVGLGAGPAVDELQLVPAGQELALDPQRGLWLVGAVPPLDLAEVPLASVGQAHALTGGLDHHGDRAHAGRGVQLKAERRRIPGPAADSEHVVIDHPHPRPPVAGLQVGDARGTALMRFARRARGRCAVRLLSVTGSASDEPGMQSTRPIPLTGREPCPVTVTAVILPGLPVGRPVVSRRSRLSWMSP